MQCLFNLYQGFMLAPEQLQEVQILDNRIYFHKVFRVKYTTYDMRRAQDSINPRTL
jgi:hypothetical protein